MRKNYYAILRDKVAKFIDRIESPHTATVYFYDAPAVNANRILGDLMVQVIAGRKLNHEVVVTETSGQLWFTFRQKLPNRCEHQLLN